MHTPSTTLSPAAPEERRGPGVRLEMRGRVGHLVLDRPPLNVLDLATLAELDDACAALSNERSLTCVVLRGAGRAFCAGVDVADHTDDRVDRMLELFHGAVRRLMALPCPVVAAVHGATLGGGCELMMACDMVLASENARIGQPEIRLGAFPPVAAAVLPRLIGRQRALDLILTGRVIGAGEAREMGLVTRVLPTAEFEAGVDAYARELASLSGPVLRLAKRAVLEGSEGTVAEAIGRAEWLYLRDLVPLEDAREGLRAFMEKRDPVWKEA
jgi:cyclohexa-1,5-dienecarbonyl-CoA hydratase